MKQCPVCKTTYTDQTLQFCLADGASLSFVPEDAEKTIAMPFESSQMRGTIQPDSVPTVFPAAQANQPVRKGVSPLVVALLCLIFLLVAGGLIGFASYIWFKPDAGKNLTAANTATPTPALSPTLDKETDELKQKLANLEKQVADQKNQKKSTSAETFSTPPPDNRERTARANSPGDGFLALRSEPNSETGYRIAKIPHGATVTVFGCPKPSNIGKMAGHWCQVNYNGQAGWAFDGFLVF